MTTNVTPSSGAPSGQESIEAMYYHREKSGIFDMIARHPQVGVYENFLKEWAIVVAYVERKVHRCKRAVDAVYQKRKDHGRLDDFEDEEALESLTHALSLHCVYSQHIQCIIRANELASPSSRVSSEEEFGTLAIQVLHELVSQLRLYWGGRCARRKRRVGLEVRPRWGSRIVPIRCWGP